MTPEEFKRAMDFIVEQLARFEAAIDREREERLQQWKQDQPRIARVEATLVAMGELNALTSELIGYQSRRLERHDENFRQLREESKRYHEETHARLHQIQNRLSGNH